MFLSINNKIISGFYGTVVVKLKNIATKIVEIGRAYTLS
jgi:hypothetical protein